MTEQESKIAIVGAGFSGVSLAVHLYRKSKKSIDIYLIESGPEFAKGAAYSTPFDFHLLNVPAGKMSASEDQPDDFVKWLQTFGQHEITSSSTLPIEKQFVPRKLYGNYLQSLLDSCQNNSKNETRIIKIKAYLKDLKQKSDQLELTFQNDSTERFDKVILALGNQPPKSFFVNQPKNKYLNNPWDWDAYKKLNLGRDILIVGTGLTMIDTMLTLEHLNFENKIYAISRHGLTPHVHKIHSKSTEFSFDVNPNLTPKKLLRKIRQFLKENPELDWRAVIDSLRPVTQQIWCNWSTAEKKRFLRHAKAFWEIHRHRIAPQIAKKFEELETKGKLQVLAGKVIRADFSKKEPIQVELQMRKEMNQRKKSTLEVGGIINCTGPESNFDRIETPLVKSMRENGFIQADQLKLGLEIDENFALIQKHGETSKNLFAIGPLCKGKLWEITAVPDIRKQTKQLAEYLLSKL